MIRLLASEIDIRLVRYQHQLKLLQDTAPILTSLILKLPFDDDIPADVCSEISQLCDLAIAPYSNEETLFPSSTTRE